MHLTMVLHMHNCGLTIFLFDEVSNKIIKNNINKHHTHQREGWSMRARQQWGGGINISPCQAPVLLLGKSSASRLTTLTPPTESSYKIDERQFSYTKQVHIIIVNMLEHPNREHTQWDCSGEFLLHTIEVYRHCHSTTLHLIVAQHIDMADEPEPTFLEP